jgi:xanthine/uracil/vitamin C permease (AzgA family)
MSDQSDEELTDGGRAMQAADAFDLRRIIGGLFLLYGIVLTIIGAFDSSAQVTKAAGVRINLWAGLGMIVFAVLFIAWALWRPLSRQLAEAQEGAEPAA